MEILILSIFIVGYLAIAFEHPLKVDKAAAALLTGVGTWTVFEIFGPASPSKVNDSLSHHLSGIAEILFFLLGAMTIVELIDAHGGFELITNRIKTRKKVSLLWILGIIAFFLAAIIDSVPAAVVMYSVIKKLMTQREDRLITAGMMVIAVNAGGVWSPLGNLPTLMLWSADNITIQGIIFSAFLPSVINLVVPLGILSFRLKGNVEQEEIRAQSLPDESPTSRIEKIVILGLGLGGLVFVPVFKIITHLPPYLGMMLVLGVIWVVADRMGSKKEKSIGEMLSPSKILERIDTPSVLFFLGILLSVACLEVSGILAAAATWLDQAVPNRNLVTIGIGLLSAIVDNVPLVAATIEMYPQAIFPELGTDAFFWQFLAYTAGTGGSILIIGSAAGVAMMGVAQIDFLWYLRRIAWLSICGYVAGTITFLLLENL